jgi:hypothetical protein
MGPSSNLILLLRSPKVLDYSRKGLDYSNFFGSGGGFWLKKLKNGEGVVSVKS